MPTRINDVTYECPNCKTSIKIKVPTDAHKVDSLFQKVNTLRCPICEEQWHDAQFVLRAVKDYNNSVAKVSSYHASNITLA